MRVQNFPILATTLTVSAVLSLAACGQKQEDKTVGQKIDSTIDKVEQKTDQATAAIKSETEAAKESTGRAVDEASAKLKDATITTSIKAELAKDASLSALKINVDTSNGRVTLHGPAPDSLARERATQLAKGVDGVVSVDNQLLVKN